MVAVVARGATFANPVLGFDEQFYLLVGDRMLQGAVPYVDIFDRKPIGLFLIYAFARLLGGDGFVQYKLVALGCVIVTALLIYRLARRSTSQGGALAAAVVYILWLDFMEGEGGQAEVFVNLAMAIAATAVLAAFGHPAQRRHLGPAAMLAVGIGMQIKYSALGEGIFFGCALLWLDYHQTTGPARAPWLAIRGVVLIACALVPTVAALAWYTAHGHRDAFVFANFVSLLGQSRSPFLTEIRGLVFIAAILSPLLLFAIAFRRHGSGPQGGSEQAVVRAWLASAIIAMIAFWRFDSPHYAIPILLPMTVLLAPAFAGAARRRATIALVGVALLAGQAVVAVTRAGKGGGVEAERVAAAASPGAGCIYVYDGYPALYMLTHSCLPTRWAFPGHLNTADEAHRSALGIDPVEEVRRVMATHPKAVIVDAPRFAFGNAATYAIVARALAEDYRLAARVMTGRDRARLVYRERIRR